MKTINTFLLEKLKLGRDTKSHEMVTVNLPYYDYDEGEVHMNKIWKAMHLPETSYIIFKDKYRQDKPHFQTTEDFVASLILFEDDYEGFDPAEDILYASNDLQEILEWYFNYIGIHDLPDSEDPDEWAEKNYRVFNAKSEDNPHPLAYAYTGQDRYYADIKPVNYNEMASFLHDYGMMVIK